jgi:uncharacterized protein (TIGR03437 family)
MRLHWLAVFFLLQVSAVAQPFVYYRSIVNAASFVPPGLPNGSIARGSVFAIFGRSFGPVQTARAAGFPLGTTLQGVGVSVCQNGVCIPAIPVYVSAGQVNAIMPANAPLGPVSARVNFNGQGGYYASANVVKSSFGISAVNGSAVNVLESYESLNETWRDVFAQNRAPYSPREGAAFGPGSIQNVSADGPAINSASNPAKPGQRVILWGTGLGAGLNADNEAPESGDLPVKVEIWVGGKEVTAKHYSGRSSCCAGIDQIVFDLPEDTPSGCYVPIQVRTDEQVVSNSVSIAVSPDGTACSDPSNPSAELLRAGGRFGFILANRVNAVLNFLTESPQEETVDFGLATFRRENGGPFAYNALLSLPPPGSCTVHAISGDFLAGAVIAGFRGSGGELDAAGSVSIGGVELQKSGTGAIYSTGTLAGTPAGFRKRNLPESVLSGASTVRGTGSASIGSFEFELAPSPDIRLLNRLDGQTVDRAEGVTVGWEGTDTPGNVLIAGINSNVPESASAAFLCTATAAAGSFRVPPGILQSLPPSPDRAYVGHGFGYLLAGVMPADVPSSISVSGLDRILSFTTSWSAKMVRYK